jgi:hypothetical protein
MRRVKPFLLIALLITFAVRTGVSREILVGFQLTSCFRMELVVGEPLIESPVTFEWGPDGKLWVVEMLDYPKESLTEGNKPNGGVHNGRIVCLEDATGDGIYDKSTVFLDGLNFPNSVFPWRKGVIVSADGEIFYAEATNGDGKANIHKTILAGFTPGNPQHRLNGFEYGLSTGSNHIYAQLRAWQHLWVAAGLIDARANAH